MKAPAIVLLLAALTTGAAAPGFAQPAPGSSPDLIIRNARVLDGMGAVLEDVVITIRDGLILSVSQKGAYTEGEDLSWEEEEWMWDWEPEDIFYASGVPWEELAASAPERIVIDAGGGTVLPGLIDTHVHLLDGSSITDEASLRRYLKWGLPEKLDAYLAHGVTTIKSMGDPEDAILRVRDRIARGELAGPRLHVVGPVLTIPGAGGYTAAALFRLSEWPRAHTTVELTTVEEARRVVRELAEKGVDALHLDLCSLSPSFSIILTPYAQEILSAVIDEAHKGHIPVTAYTVEEAVALSVIAMGIDGVEHGVTRSWLKDDTFQRRLGMQNVSYAPALGVYATLLPENLEAAMDNLEHLADGGWVRIVLGTDTFGEAPPGLNTIQEMELMVQAGMTPARVIRAATCDAAEHLGMSKELGTIQAGKRADMIMVDRDPLRDIAALREVRLVIQDGRVVVDRREETLREDVR